MKKLAILVVFIFSLGALNSCTSEDDYQDFTEQNIGGDLDELATDEDIFGE